MTLADTVLQAPDAVIDPQTVIDMLESAQHRAVRDALLTGDLTGLQKIQDAINRMTLVAISRRM